MSFPFQKEELVQNKNRISKLIYNYDIFIFLSRYNDIFPHARRSQFCNIQACSKVKNQNGNIQFFIKNKTLINLKLSPTVECRNQLDFQKEN